MLGLLHNGETAPLVLGTNSRGRTGSAATSQNEREKSRRMRCCCCLDVSLSYEGSPLGPWPSRPLPRAVGHHFVTNIANETCSSLKSRSSSDPSNSNSNINSKQSRPTPPPPAVHPKVQERKFLLKRPHHQSYGSRSAAPLYQFTHFFQLYDHIDDYRKCCCSTSTIQSSSYQTSTGSVANGGLTVKNTVATCTPSVMQMTTKERPPERQAADINYIIFECPTRHDTSLLYRPLLFARNSGQPSNASSRLLAEYWSSAASTVESMMQFKGSTHSVNGSVHKNGADKHEEQKEDPLLVLQQQNNKQAGAFLHHIERRLKEKAMIAKEDKSVGGGGGGGGGGRALLELQVESMTLNEAKCNCHNSESRNRASSISSSNNSCQSPDVRSKSPTDAVSCQINDESKIHFDINSSKTNLEQSKTDIDAKSNRDRGISDQGITRVDYPIFVAEEASSVTSTSSAPSEGASPSSSLRRPIHSNVYSNPFEYSTNKEEDSISHKASGRLLAGRIRAISDSGVTGGDESIGKSLQSKSLFKNNSCTSSKEGLVRKSSEDQTGFVPPTNSLPNFLNLTFSQYNGIPPNGIPHNGIPPNTPSHSNRDLLYVGVNPRPVSHEVIPQSISSRVKHRLTLCGTTSPPPPPPQESSTIKKNSKAKHSRHCFKKSLSRRISSTNRWMVVDHTLLSAKGSKTLPTLDDIVAE